MVSNELMRLKVHADARENRLEKRGEAAYEIWVKAPAERRLANAAALGLLARELGCPAKCLRLVKGSLSPSKIVQRMGGDK